ncbi:MAG: hypothetical protein ACLTBD_03545 [Clostridia bacterium]
MGLRVLLLITEEGKVNLTNYFHIIEHADELTQMLAENQGIQ